MSKKFKSMPQLKHGIVCNQERNSHAETYKQEILQNLYFTHWRAAELALERLDELLPYHVCSV